MSQKAKDVWINGEMSQKLSRFELMEKNVPKVEQVWINGRECPQSWAGLNKWENDPKVEQVWINGRVSQKLRRVFNIYFE